MWWPRNLGGFRVKSAYPRGSQSCELTKVGQFFLKATLEGSFLSPLPHNQEDHDEQYSNSRLRQDGHQMCRQQGLVHAPDVLDRRDGYASQVSSLNEVAQRYDFGSLSRVQADRPAEN